MIILDLTKEHLPITLTWDGKNWGKLEAVEEMWMTNPPKPTGYSVMRIKALDDNEVIRTKEEILASLQYHLNEAQRLTELMQEHINKALNGKEYQGS